MAEETPIEPRPSEVAPVGLPEGTRLVRVVLLQDGEEPSAFLIERRLRALRQLYTLLFLLRSDNIGIAAVMLDEDPEADLHFSGSSLGVFAAGQGSFWVDVYPLLHDLHKLKDAALWALAALPYLCQYATPLLEAYTAFMNARAAKAINDALPADTVKAAREALTEIFRLVASLALVDAKAVAEFLFRQISKLLETPRR